MITRVIVRGSSCFTTLKRHTHCTAHARATPRRCCGRGRGGDAHASPSALARKREPLPSSTPKQHQLSACTQPSIPRCCAGTRMEATGSAMHCGYLRHKRHTKNPSARAPARNGCNRSRGCGTRPEPPSLAYNCMVLEGKVLPKTSEFPSRDPRRLLPALLAVSESLPLRNESGLAPNLRTGVSSNFVCVRACVRACVRVSAHVCMHACLCSRSRAESKDKSTTQTERARAREREREREHTRTHACIHGTDTLSGETDTTVHRPLRAI